MWLRIDNLAVASPFRYPSMHACMLKGSPNTDHSSGCPSLLVLCLLLPTAICSRGIRSGKARIMLGKCISSTSQPTSLCTTTTATRQLRLSREVSLFGTLFCCTVLYRTSSVNQQCHSAIAELRIENCHPCMLWIEDNSICPSSIVVMP